MDFLLEDMSTDSTSVLKDRRHPSLSSINPGLKPGPKLGRVVSLNRSQSQLQPKRKNSTTQQQIVKPVVPKRTRYVSEGHYNSSQELNKMVGSRFFVCAPSDVSKSNSTLCAWLKVAICQKNKHGKIRSWKSFEILENSIFSIFPGNGSKISKYSSAMLTAPPRRFDRGTICLCSIFRFCVIRGQPKSAWTFIYREMSIYQ